MISEDFFGLDFGLLSLQGQIIDFCRSCYCPLKVISMSHYCSMLPQATEHFFKKKNERVGPTWCTVGYFSTNFGYPLVYMVRYGMVKILMIFSHQLDLQLDLDQSKIFPKSMEITLVYASLKLLFA